ncbi:MAG: protein translocase subunit SecD [Methylocystis sp.]|nr:protein translocase subunit SecD [Methylocystis sp.]MCA3584043.1 protein translocase subunit SecD [Methylocystis sp.]MCA3586687.1 protein translocase subunit SecD [Methylocystis sp.]MCA3591657.1 protein translocase subunit SecD [Methylocystis sp.]
MLKFSKFKIIAVLLLAIASVVYTLPNLWTEATREQVKAAFPSWVPAAIIPHRAIPLGLDLQGGVHLLMEADTAGIVRLRANVLQQDVRRVLRENTIPIVGGVGVSGRSVQVRLAENANRELALSKLRELSVPIGNAVLGQSGARTLIVEEPEPRLIRLTVTDEEVRDQISRIMAQSIEVVRRRIDDKGIKEPNLQRQGQDRILIQMPGERDPERIKRLVNAEAQLEFRMVADDPGIPEAETIVLPYSEGGGTIRVFRRAEILGQDLASARPGFGQNGQPVVNFQFNTRAAMVFGRLTSENVGRRFAMVLDGKVISAPSIRVPITGGSGYIEGNFTPQSANELAVLLSAGSLPIKLTTVEERTVGPGLGQDAIEAGKLAAMVAAALVAGYMLLTYGLFGIFANLALLVHILLILAAMAFLGATMTLPGIAGIVLTIGTAVDANVLIYERMREEQQMGRSLISALEAGFNRAFATIMDSNVTMFIAALILYLLGTGPVKGFAVTMIIGILTTVITAVTMTRMMIALWYRWAKPKKLPF